MCIDQPYLRILWRVQKEIQYQVMENLYWLLQLFADCSNHWRKDLYYAWGLESGFELNGADPSCDETHRCMLEPSVKLFPNERRWKEEILPSVPCILICWHSQIPDCGLLCDLLWSDPDKDITGWSENDRGVSFTFGPDVVSRFLQKHDMDLICRAHQVVEDGYEFFSKRQLVTLFSAPNYCGEFDNAGAMMSVDESLLCSFQVSNLS